MSFDTPLAEPGRTRRSSRLLPAPTAASAADPLRPGADSPNTDAVAPTPLSGSSTERPAAPLSRRARRLLATPTVAIPVTMSGDAAPAEPVDEFTAAAKLFSFTGENPVMRPAPAAEQEPVAEPVAEAVPGAEPVPAPRMPALRRARRGVSFRRMATASFSVGVIGIVGLLAVGMTTPVEAVAAATGTGPVAAAATQLSGDVERSSQIQAYVAPSQIQNPQIARTENYQTARLVDLAGSEGISNFSSAVFTNNPSCPIQWPFAVGVTMSYGFGMRDGVMHEGVDFTPGDGAHIQAIADGVVRISTDSGGAYGVTVVIDHVIDGQLVSSRYGHMQYGSRQVEVGDHVSVGEYIGRTGDTGRSFGAHTHVEILAGGATAIDPMPWFQQHAHC